MTSGPVVVVLYRCYVCAGPCQMYQVNAVLYLELFEFLVPYIHVVSYQCHII